MFLCFFLRFFGKSIRHHFIIKKKKNVGLYNLSYSNSAHYEYVFFHVLDVEDGSFRSCNRIGRRRFWQILAVSHQRRLSSTINVKKKNVETQDIFVIGVQTDDLFESSICIRYNTTIVQYP